MKKLLVALFLLLTIVISVFLVNDKTDKPEVSEYDEILRQEYFFVRNYLKEFAVPDVKKVEYSSGLYVVLMHDGTVFTRELTYDSTSAGDKAIDSLVIDQSVFGSLVKNIELQNDVRDETVLVLELEDSSIKIVEIISEKNREEDPNVESCMLNQNGVYVYDITPNTYLQDSDIKEIQYSKNPEFGVFLNTKGELWSFGTGSKTRLGLGRDSVEFNFNDFFDISRMQSVDTRLVLDDDALFQGNVKSFNLVYPNYESWTGRLSIVNNSGELYISGLFFGKFNEEFQEFPMYNMYSEKPEYVEEIEPIQGSIRNVYSTNYYDLLLTDDGRLYYFGLEPNMIDVGLNEVGTLTFFELLHDGNSMSVDDVRCTRIGYSGGCAIMIDNEPYYYDMYTVRQDQDFIGFSKYSITASSVIPRMLSNLVLAEVYVDINNSWYFQDSGQNHEKILVMNTFEKYLNERPEKFSEVSIEDLREKLGDLVQ